MCLWMYQVILLQALLYLCFGDNFCAPPNIKHGEITVVSSNSRKYVGIVGCDPPYALVGQNLIKCMNGIWSSEIPVCTNLSGCDISSLPEIENGRRRAIKSYRGSVVRYTCGKGYKLYGRRRVHCDSYEHWNLDRPPVCVRKGCDETVFGEFPNGKSKRLLSGEVYVFQCDEGSTRLQGSRTIYCNGKNWNDTVPKCIASPGRPRLYLNNSKNVQISNIQVNDVGIKVVCMSSSPTDIESPSLALYKEGRLIKEAHKSSKLILPLPKITKDDDQTTYVCSASNAFTNSFGNDEKNVARMKLNVTGSSQFVSVQMNSRPGIKRIYLRDNEPSFIRIECLSDESKPPTHLKWKTQFDSAIIGIHDMTHSSSRPYWSRAQSLLSLNVSFIESNIKVECTDGNNNMDGIVLVKIYAPKEVHISGNTLLKYNERTLLTCLAGQSKPASKIYWAVPKGIQYNVSNNKLNDHISHLHLGPVEQKGSKQSPSFLIKCIVKHPALKNKGLSSQVLVNISYPPGTPQITTNNEMPLEVGQKVVFICSASLEGNSPSSELIWTLDNQMLAGNSSQGIIENKHYVSYLSLLPRLSDHGKQLRCQWKNNNSTLWKDIFHALKLFIVEPLLSHIEDSSSTSSIRTTEFIDSSTSSIRNTEFIHATSTLPPYFVTFAYKTDGPSTQKSFLMSTTIEMNRTTLGIFYDSNLESNTSYPVDSSVTFDFAYLDNERANEELFEVSEGIGNNTLNKATSLPGMISYGSSQNENHKCVLIFVSFGLLSFITN